MAARRHRAAVSRRDRRCGPVPWEDVGELFLDDRGQALRVTWHAEAGRVVLSIWRADECVGTVRLSAPEALRLAHCIDEAVGPQTPAGKPAPAPAEAP